MPNTYFQFKQFLIHQDRSAMKVTTDACLFGAWVAREISNHTNNINHILDIGTGTGVLSLMLAQKSAALIDAIEIESSAFHQAQENIRNTAWSDRVEAIHADAREYEYRRKYHLVISNPPFYENEIRSQEGIKNIAHHSSQLTLKELLGVITSTLSDNGLFFLLLPYKRDKEIRNLVKKQSLCVTGIVFVRQSPHHDYFRLMIKGKSSASPLTEITMEEISIWDDKQQYTEEFRALLKDYYLNI